MRIRILADIHESLTNLRWAIDVLREQGADRFVVLGDVFELGHRLKETVDLLADARLVAKRNSSELVSGLCAGSGNAAKPRRPKKPLSITDFLSVYRVEPGDRMGGLT